MDSPKVPDYNDPIHDVPDEFGLWKIEYSAWNVPQQYIPVQNIKGMNDKCYDGVVVLQFFQGGFVPRPFNCHIVIFLNIFNLKSTKNMIWR
jgi:hypothetical protein